MHKRSSWIFILFAVLIIAGVASCLVFWPKGEKDDLQKPDEITQGDNNDETNSGGDNNEDCSDDDLEDEEQIFTTLLEIYLPEQVCIKVGAEVTLLSGYIQVQPSEMASEVNSSIIPKYQSSVNGLEFENSKLKANIEGTYDLTFSVKKSATERLTKTIEVIVHSDSSISHVEQIKNSIIKAEAISIFELFNFNITNYDISCDENTTLQDEYITTSQTGNSVITINLIENYLQYSYKFHLTIKDQPLYSIVLTNVANNALEIDLSSPVKFIYFQIKNRKEEIVDQFVTTNIEDESIVSVEKVTDLYIKIKALKEGTTNLKIVCGADESVYVSIQIIVK